MSPAVGTTAVTLRAVDRASPVLQALFEAMMWRRRLGYDLSGRFCLSCDAPLFTEELLHVPPDPDALSVTDAVRWAGSSYNEEARR